MVYTVGDQVLEFKHLFEVGIVVDDLLRDYVHLGVGLDSLCFCLGGRLFL